MEKKNKVDMLNVLRGIAFMMVFLLHTKIFVPIPWNEGFYRAWLFYTPAWAGVWIFFTLSGYGIAAGFYNKKYELSINGIFHFYVKRIAGIVPVYWFYLITVLVFIKPDLIVPGKENFYKLLSLFLFQYQEEFYSIEFGSSWYLTTLMRLYLVAPLGYYILKRIEKKRSIYFSLVILLAAGFVARIAMGYHIAVSGQGNWAASIYKPFYFNLDMFFSGFLLHALKNFGRDRKWRFIPRIGAMASLLLLILYNCKIYYDSAYNGADKLDIYCYILPSVYIVTVLFYIYQFDTLKNYIQEKLGLSALKKNVFRIFDYFNKIQLPMYLFHSSVLLCLAREYNDVLFSRWCVMFHISPFRMNFVKGCLFTLAAFIITVVWAVMVNMLLGKRNYNIIDKLYKIDYEGCWRNIKEFILKIAAKLFPI